MTELGSGDPVVTKPGRGSWRDPSNVTLVISSLLVVIIGGLFAILAIRAADTADAPPRVADVVPTAAPSPTGGSLPPQFRGAYDPNARILGVLGVVAPLVTTIVGFYFGARTGQAERREAETKATVATAQTAQLAHDVARQLRPTNPALLEELRASHPNLFGM